MEKTITTTDLQFELENGINTTTLDLLRTAKAENLHFYNEAMDKLKVGNKAGLYSMVKEEK